MTADPVPPIRVTNPIKRPPNELEACIWRRRRRCCCWYRVMPLLEWRNSFCWIVGVRDQRMNGCCCAKILTWRPPCCKTHISVLRSISLSLWRFTKQEQHYYFKNYRYTGNDWNRQQPKQEKTPDLAYHHNNSAQGTSWSRCWCERRDGVLHIFYMYSWRKKFQVSRMRPSLDKKVRLFTLAWIFLM